LSLTTAKWFDRDPKTNEVLWFASPPLNRPHAKGSRHSLVYMQFLAAKRRRASEDGKRRDEMDVDTKAGKRVHPQTVTEITRQVLKELPLEGPA
jgi:chromatin structure-remodeling complex subunit RSC1/2